MKAMVLAAGLGTRLGVLGAAMPKILIDVGGRSLLARHVEFLVQLGVERIVINTHHHADKLRRASVSFRLPLMSHVSMSRSYWVRLAGTQRPGGSRSGSVCGHVRDVLFPDPMDG